MMIIINVWFKMIKQNCWHISYTACRINFQKLVLFCNLFTIVIIEYDELWINPDKIQIHLKVVAICGLQN
jgi:hypothetical protein